MPQFMRKKVCDMRTSLKYAEKMRQHAKYAVNAYSRETDMPNQQGGLAYR